MYIDIAVGLLIGWGVSLLTGESHFHLMLFGVLATLAPDFDFLIWLGRNKWRVNQYAHEHRDLLHLPLIFGVGGGILIALWNPVYGLVWFLGTMAHFVHDTLDGGWGIQWLHPFYRGYFTLASYSPQHHFRNKDEQRAIASVHGNPHWLEDQYLKPNLKLFAELATLGLVLLVLVWWLLV